MIDVLIRSAEVADVAALSEMDALLFSDAWSADGIASSLASSFSLAFVALAEGKAVGYLLGSVLAPEGELLRIGVRPEYRKNGIGGRLMDALIREARARLCDTLFLEVRSKNAAAVSLYRRYGFSDCGCRKGYYKNPPDDALLMKAEI